MTPDDPHLHPVLADALRRFEDWRSTRTGQDRIPAHLWRAAVRCAARCGLNRTVLVLRLDYNSLKKHMMAAAPLPAAPGPRPAFVELVAPAGKGPVAFTLEVERPGGAKLRVEIQCSALPDLADLARRFATEGA